MCLSTFHDRAWVTNNADNSVSVIDCGTDTVETTIPVGLRPTAVAFDPQAGVFIANTGDGTITVLRPDGEHTVVTVDSGPAGVDVVPIGLANLHSSGLLVVINRDGGVARIEHGQLANPAFFVDGGEGLPFAGGPRSPHGVAAAPGLNPFVYVSSPANERVSVFDTSSGFPRRRAEIRVGQRPLGVATHPRQPTAYVTNDISASVSVLRGDDLVETISVGDHPHALAVGPDDRLWVAHGTGAISQIDVFSRTVVATLDVGAQLEGIIVSQVTGKAYVACRDENTVIAIDPVDG